MESEFEIDSAEALKVSDAELTALLTRVYVAGGYTREDNAVSLFAAAAVRARGLILGARDAHTARLAGMIIVVPPQSSARRLARESDAEIHLLAIAPEYRRRGLARALVRAAVATAETAGYPGVMLWTQRAMTAARQLYQSEGFAQVDRFERDGRSFLVYAKALRGRGGSTRVMT